MKKVEVIERLGEEEWERRLKSSRRWRAENRDRAVDSTKQWRITNPEKVKKDNEVNNLETNRRGGKYYERHKQSQMVGIPHEKTLIRQKHQRRWTPLKRIIAPNSELHHQWQMGTANYDGVALVEKDQHRYGIIDVIQILEGEITLLTEEEIRNRRA